MKKNVHKWKEFNFHHKIKFKFLLLIVVSLFLFFFTQNCGILKQKPNILLISIDALRADHLGCYGYPRQTSPFIDSLAKEGMVFLNALTPLPATDPSFASLFTSQHPIKHNLLSNGFRLSDKLETLAEVLQKKEYFTMGAVAVDHLGSKYNFNKGFDVYSDQWSVKEYENTSHRRVAPSVNKDVYRMLDSYTLEKKEKPFFLFIHYFDVHRPYIKRKDYTLSEEIPEDFLPRKTEEIYNMIDNYDSEIRFVDNYIKELYLYLEKLGLTKNLIICVTADHGEQLGEHGYTGGHADIYRETIRIPLIIQGKGIKKGVIKRNVSLMDISPSFLALLKMRFSAEINGQNFFRKSLFSLAASGKSKRDRQRNFLIMGYPYFTRSLGIIEEEYWYIKNLDFIYSRDLFIEDIEGKEKNIERESFKEAPILSSNGFENLYLIDIPFSNKKIDSLYVTVYINLKNNSDSGKALITLYPRIPYIKKPVIFSQAIKIHYPINSIDISSITVSPNNSIADVFYKITKYKEFKNYLSQIKQPYRRLTTDFYIGLLTERKKVEGDELYNIRLDPKMVHNLIKSPEYDNKLKLLNANIDDLIMEYQMRRSIRSIGSKFTKEEIQALQALGYIK